MHNKVQVWSLKNYTPEFLMEESTKINFSDYNIFSNVNITYLNLAEKVWSIVDKNAPLKDLKIKNNTQDWFDEKLHIDEKLYKNSEHLEIKLIKEKKKAVLSKKNKLKENIGKSKEPWEAIKSLGLPFKKVSISNIFLKKRQRSKFWW